MKKVDINLRQIVQEYVRHRYAILFYSLLLSIVAIPVFAILRISGRFLEIFFAANLIAAIIPIGSSRIRVILLILMIVSFGTQLGEVWVHQYRFLNRSIVVWTVVAVLAAVSALRFSLRASTIDSEHIFAALSAYLLAGIFLGDFYWILEQTWPGTLRLVGGIPGGDFSLSTAVYFSFITLSTLGYGDIVPHSDIARGLAIVEAVTGQLYLAVMVARLVSLYVTQPKASKNEN